MKRTYAALVVVLLAAAGPARAQSSIVAQIAGDKAASPKLYFSLKFGLNFATLSGIAGPRRTGGFNAGLTATVRLTDRLSLVPEITPFSNKGVSGIPFDTTGDPALDPFFADPKSSELGLSYTDVPVLVVYRLGRFGLGAGAYAGLLSTARETFVAKGPGPVTGGPETAPDLTYTRRVTPSYRSTDLGLVFEGSWTITKPRRGVGLVFHFRFQAGLVDVLKTPPSSGPQRNSVIQAYLSFPFVY